jgi:hypothetical protein
MRLPHPFIRLPIRFDAARLVLEIDSVDESLWRPHPQGHAGNWALPLVAANGDPNDDATRGAMLPTPVLARMPYVRQVMARLGSAIGRSRLMRLDGNAEATSHVDTNYYWMGRVRIHVPVVTRPEVEFLCGDARVHMRAGECWIFDTFSAHNVLNPLPTRRIHLVIDSVGSDAFWDLVAYGYAPPRGELHPRADESAPLVAFDPQRDAQPETELRNQPEVMSPFEVAHWIETVLRELDERNGLEPVARRFHARWTDHFARHGEAASAHAGYAALLQDFDRELGALKGRFRLRNTVDATESLRHCIVRAALNPGLYARAPVPRAVAPARKIERPLIIVSPPRSGSTLLFETLAKARGAWTIGGESHALIETIRELHPASHDFESNRLTARDATPEIAAELIERFVAELRDRDGEPPPPDAHGLQLVEKTPKNSLRIPFLAALFPDARFLYLHREPRQTLSSMLDAWRSQRFVTYAQLPGWRYPNVPGWSATLSWSLALANGWREWMKLPLPDLVAKQWSAIVDTMLGDLAAIDSARVAVADYSALLADPQAEMQRVCAFAGLEWDRTLDAPLPLSKHTLTPPDPDKWKRNAAEVERMLTIATPSIERLEHFVRARRDPRAVGEIHSKLLANT